MTCLICDADMIGANCPQCHGVFVQTLTLRLLAAVQHLMFRVSQLRAPSLFARLTRAETYLIVRYNRETPEEAAVFEMVNPTGA